MQFFVQENSIVKKIWGKSDTVLFIFAGAAAEFALNKAVDWLYFTGKLPADPIGRLFSTVTYARKIVFAPMEEANKAIHTMRQIHTAVEKNRGAVIPDWAYRDVLFMLIHYSIASYELLKNKLTPEEKEEVYNVFYRVGVGMGLTALPPNYQQWLPVREAHLMQDLVKSDYTADLFKQYKKHLGPLRYAILLQAQNLVVPLQVRQMLQAGNGKMLLPLLWVYKGSRAIKADWFLKSLLLPAKYKPQIKDLDRNGA